MPVFPKTFRIASFSNLKLIWKCFDDLINYIIIQWVNIAIYFLRGDKAKLIPGMLPNQKIIICLTWPKPLHSQILFKRLNASTHSVPMHPFFTHWKHQKTVRFSVRVEKGCIGNKWVKSAGSYPLLFSSKGSLKNILKTSLKKMKFK